MVMTSGTVTDHPGQDGQQPEPTSENEQSQGRGSQRGGPALLLSPGGLSTCHIATRAQGGSFFNLEGYPVVTEEKDKPKRGVITEFSARSRRRMMTSLAIVDQTKIGLPAFMSLTYPDEALPITERQTKRHLAALRVAYMREYGKKPILWRREMQARKSGQLVGAFAPHVHLLTWGLEPTEDDRRWLADTWCRIVGTGLEKHWLVTFHRKSWFMPDSWQGTMAYVSKYCAKVSNMVCVGRSWGWWWRELVPVTLISDEIPQDSFHAVRRVLRAYIGKRCKGRRPKIYHRWQGLSAYLSAAGGEKLVRWAWDVGWTTSDHETELCKSALCINA